MATRFFLCAGGIFLLLSTAAPAAELVVKQGDHIAIVGNTLADRMQHYGYVEAMLQDRFPQHRLVIRNLGFSGDTLTTQPRSDNFGSPDQWLSRIEADTVFAFFGYNESFGGQEGLGEFRNQLADWIRTIRGRKYNGESAPQIVLFSPIAHEDLANRHLPDGSENNARLEMYTTAMREVATEHDVVFVDLFHPTLESYAQLRTAKKTATINGIHLNDVGYEILSRHIEHRIFGSVANRTDRLEKTRHAVLAKNHVWHNIYRATDGYSVFGGRSTLRFVDGQTNRDVMDRELEILGAMTQNRDAAIWSVVGGGDARVDDSNLPQPLNVKTNKPGLLDGGLHRFLGGEEAIQEMTVHSGMSIGLFASEEQFPELVNPVQSAVDSDGRLWVAAWPTYPHWNPLEPMNDKLLILPDDDGDGRADRCITFADGLHNPTGFEFWNGGVLVAMAPDIFFLKDTDGDDRADIRERIFHGLDSADTHHTCNSITMGPSGRFYFSRGIFHYENFETPWAATFRAGSSPCGVFEFDPLRFDIRFQFPVGPNPHGDVFDQWGNQFATDGTGGTGYYVGFPGRGPAGELYTKRVRPVPATAILDSPHFPEANRGNILIANVIGFQGVTQYQFEHNGASIRATEVEPIVYSTDPNFRPSDMEIGGDGALYILDWQNPLIGHMQHNLRDPSRDHRHGRVYRVTANGRETIPVAKLSRLPTDQVVEHLAAPTLSERYRTRLELTGRDSVEVTDTVRQWASKYDPALKSSAIPLTEALWIHQQHRIVDPALLNTVLSSKDENARAAAVKVLTEWTILPPKAPDRNHATADVESAINRLILLAQDPAPKVRAQAVIAAVSIGTPRASEIVFAAMQFPTDPQLEFNLAEARRSLDLDSWIRNQLAQNRPLSSAAESYALSNASVDDLLKMEKTEGVHKAILTRDNVPLTVLRESLTGLAGLRGKPVTEELFQLIEDLNDKANAGSLNSLTRLLSDLPASELAGVRDRIAALALNGISAEARRVAFASWITADGSIAAALQQTADHPERRQELFQSMSLVTSEAARAASFQPLAELIPQLEGPKGAASLMRPGISVEYFFPSASDVAMETLDGMKPKAQAVVPRIEFEVPVLQQRDQFALRFSGLIRIDKPGDYTFFVNSDDGSRIYLNGDLLVNNDGLHGMVEKGGRVNLQAGLHSLVVTYFDNGGGDGLVVSWSGPGFGKQLISESVLAVGADQSIQELAIRAMMLTPGNEAEKSHVLSQLIQSNSSTNAAITGVLAIPTDAWNSRDLNAMGQGITSYLRQFAEKDRNSEEATRAFEVADAVIRKLPVGSAGELSAVVESLRIPVIALGTVRERMIYDRERIVVQAGQSVEFRLTNSDTMPHNFTVVQPGFMAEVGELAEATGRQPDAAQRNFIPQTSRILVASALLQPGQSESVFFEVPRQPGIYPYVCTYPGHWRRMYGALYVVADLKAYDAAPEAYVAQSGLLIKDELLNWLGRDTEWTLADLDEEVTHLPHRANSFAVGRQLFKVASCIGCHKLAGEGTPIGPDLTKLPPEYSAVDVVDHILNPSKKVDRKYQSGIFALASGSVVTGLIVEENDDAIRVVANASLPDQITVISKKEIEDRTLSNVSIMPKGVLNKLTREEILDLAAFVISGGNPKHKLYEQHDHKH
ncbi:MAG: HEAT repeat domain-containing protein [Planctomycetaceae bacterium]|nr:HEAT repeat domain-containing protein [Planctomycetaceae bacterium]